MGGWKLEIFKMAVYMSFPVATFWYFNKPKFYEDWTIKMRRELYPPENKLHTEEIQEAIMQHNKRKEEQLIKLMESEENKH
ncbi:PREDICTED: protein PET100 homolog, mitochondrial-like [Priapulus caudatus]|uniref:Protein PET100 homolog, mitochondrial-like n=1 Tax=Priapulus caudatus TaxID=37621 RepID=A0ABM1EBX2_PRICU|nr:PREDICTED: protein PET100 homolog, mitochondrial-like [Priapulus caudatus]